MSRTEEWNYFIEHLQACATAEYQSTPEYEYRKQRQLLLDERLDSVLTADSKPIVHEILFEILAATDRETEIVYRRGLLDGIWLLKNLNALGS